MSVTITTATIMELRARTNAGMMDCKRALQETAGNMDEAIKKLRLQGLAIQVKRADKEANQGIVQSASNADGTVQALVEVNSETDFVAKTDGFKAFVDSVAQHALADAEGVAEALHDEVVAIVSATGENVKVRRASRFALEGCGLIKSYIHMGGKVGVMVELGCGQAASAAQEAFAQLAHDLALQVAAANPRWLRAADIPAEVIEAEKSIYRQDPKLAGKPENIIENALQGKLRRFYSDNCLENQVFVKDDKVTIDKLLAKVGKEVGDEVVIRRYVRFQLGAA